MSSSQFVARLNAGGDTIAGVAYTVISTERDQVVVPWQSQLLAGPGVRNISLQDVCPRNRSTHLSIFRDEDAMGYVVHALEQVRVAPPRCA